MPALTDANLAYKIMCSLELISIHSKIKGCDIYPISQKSQKIRNSSKTPKNFNKYVFPTIPTFFQKLFIYID